MIPKPTDSWPPRTVIDGYWEHLLELETWYSGSPERLEEFYGRQTDRRHYRRFWSGMKDNDVRALHMPLAADIAETSAALLFGERPRLTAPDDASQQALDRLEVIVKGNQLEAFMLEAAEMCAALSGVYLVIDTDPEMGMPTLSARKPLNSHGVWRGRELVEWTSWQIVKKDMHTHWVLFEERKRRGGKLGVQYALFEKDPGDNKLKRQVDLGAIPEVDAMQLTDTELDMPEGLGVVYVPNKLPNRLAPGAPWGVGDYHNSLTLLDALDEAWSSWQRDIRLGVGRIMVSKELFTSASTFDPHRDSFLQVDLTNLLTGKENPNKLIDVVQFEMRTEEHAATCSALVREIVSRCGYAAQTFGLDIEGRAESGTALRIRERKSLTTREKKGRYWCCNLEELLWQTQLMDRAAGFADATTTPYRPEVDLEDSVVPDMTEVAQTVKDLDMAAAASTEVKVRLVHPDWTDDQVAQEVALLEQAKQVAMEAATNLPPGTDDFEEQP